MLFLNNKIIKIFLLVLLLLVTLQTVYAESSSATTTRFYDVYNRPNVTQSFNSYYDPAHVTNISVKFTPQNVYEAKIKLVNTINRETNTNQTALIKIKNHPEIKIYNINLEGSSSNVAFYDESGTPLQKYYMGFYGDHYIFYVRVPLSNTSIGEINYIYAQWKSGGILTPSNVTKMFGETSAPEIVTNTKKSFSDLSNYQTVDIIGKLSEGTTISIKKTNNINESYTINFLTSFRGNNNGPNNAWFGFQQFKNETTNETIHLGWGVSVNFSEKFLLSTHHVEDTKNKTGYVSFFIDKLTKTHRFNANSSTRYKYVHAYANNGQINIFKKVGYNTCIGEIFVYAPTLKAPFQTETTITVTKPTTPFKEISYKSSLIYYAKSISTITYTPHTVFVTANNSVFPLGNNKLEIYNNPSSINKDYRITADEDGYSIVQQGSFTRGINFNLSQKIYWLWLKNGSNWEKKLKFEVNSSTPSTGSLKFYVKDELTGSAISDFNLTISNNSHTLYYNNSNSPIEIPNGTVTGGEYTVKFTKKNYTTRYFSVKSPGDHTIYLLNETAAGKPLHTIQFSLIDNTGNFPYDNTKLIIKRTSSLGEMIVSSGYFDIAGTKDFRLLDQEQYILYVECDGKSRIAGHIVPITSKHVRLVLGEIPINSNNTDFTFTIEKSNESITFDWLNLNNSLLEDFNFTITPKNNTSNPPFTISTQSQFGRITYDIPDIEDTYEITLTGNTKNRTIDLKEIYKPGQKIIFLDGIPIEAQNIASLFLLIIIALLFSAHNSKIGVFITAILASVLYTIGILHISILVLSWGVFIIFLSRLGNDYIRG